MKTTKGKFTKLAIAGITAILLGAIGSGLWEVALKPLFLVNVDGIIDNASLVIRSLKDSLYVSISKGYQEKSSLYTVNLIIILMWLLLGSLVATLFRSNRTLFFKTINKEVESVNDEIDEMIKSEKVDEQKLEELKRRLESNKKKLKKLAKVFTFFIIIYASFFSAQYIIMTYKNTAITNFNQSLTSLRPSLSMDEYILFKSRFAQVRSEEDYLRIIDEMKAIALKNKIKLPIGN